MAVRVLLVLAAFATLCACGQADLSANKAGEKAGGEHAGRTAASESATQSGASAKGGVIVGEAIARAELEPVGDSGTSGTAVLKEVGDLGVQVELEVSGLATGDPDAAFYAQAHEGSCADQQTGEVHEREHGAVWDPAPVLVRFDRSVAEAQGLEAHGGHEHGIPEVPIGSIEQPISFGASADGTSSVTSLLKGVGAKRLTSGVPEYVHLHAAGSDDAPELACGDLVVANRRFG